MLSASTRAAGRCERVLVALDISGEHAEHCPVSDIGVSRGNSYFHVSTHWIVRMTDADQPTRPLALEPTPTSLARFDSSNWLLLALSIADQTLLRPLLRRVELQTGQVLAEAEALLQYHYFPEGCIVSLALGSAEVGLVGRDGLTGTATLLGANRCPFNIVVQANHSTALRITVADLRASMGRSATLQAMLLLYVQSLLVQSSYSTLSNSHHRLESRLARWLLMCHDRIDGDELRLTHESMSMMVAAQRTGVTLCLHILEGAGMIKSMRGRVMILDRTALERLAGEAYGGPEAEYRRLIGPFGRGACKA